MHVILITIGSHGDVHPFVGIGQRLAARGHDVTIATNPFFRSLVEGAGVRFKPIGTRDQYVQLTSNPDVWHPRKGGPAVLGGAAAGSGMVYELIQKYATADTVVAGSSLAFGGLIAAEKLGLRYATIHLAPMCIRSHVEMPVLPPGISFNWMPMWMRRKFWDGADKWFIDPPIAPHLNALRGRLGLAPITRVLNWWNAPLRTIGLWPDWWGPVLSDWPEQVRLAGFPLYDEADVTPLAPELDAWLSAGDAPIAFTPGSAMKFGQRFFTVAADACRRLGRRGILLTRHPEQIPSSLPAGVRHVDFAPFGTLLPRCGAIVHHGGIGTTAQAMRAGLPQLIMPMSHDQPDNAARVKRLLCGDAVSVRGFTPRRVARKLDRLLSDPVLADACRKVATRFDGADGIGRACQLLEELLEAPQPLPV